MKRLFAGVMAALLAVIPIFSTGASAISAQSAVVLDCATGRMLYARNPDQRCLIASTTKIMTALVICEQCNVLDRVRIPAEAVGIEGSSIYLRQGEILTVQELLYGMMLHSGNDAAVALAIYCAGTIEGFAQLMNDKARSLGLTGTHFENPHGLDGPDHYSTASDLASLATYAMENPIFQKIVSTKTISIGQRQLRNHNKLLWMLEYTDGVKTGFTKKAGRILVSSAQKDGRRLVAVTIADPNDWQDHMTLLQDGFSNYRISRLVAQDQPIGTVQIAGGTQLQVQLLAKEAFCYPLSDTEEPQLVLPAPGFVYAPVCSGQDAGFAQVYLQGRLIGKIPLVYGQTIEQEPPQKPGLMNRIFKGNNHDR